MIDRREKQTEKQTKVIITDSTKQNSDQLSIPFKYASSLKLLPKPLDMEPSPPFIAKKLSDLARLSFFMIRKGFSKSKFVLDDIHFLMKRGKTMGKALNELMVTNHGSLSCRSRDAHLSFVSPMDYEFSCTTSPMHRPYNPFQASKRKPRYQHTRSRTRDGRFFGAMGCRDWGDYESPLVLPKGRRVQIGESPFVLKDDDEDHYRVDEAAEEFIQRFYKQLRLQKWLAVLEAADQYG